MANSTNYIGPEELCLPEIRVKYCNLHTPQQRLCICYTPIELMRKDMPFCSRLLQLNTLENLVLTISLAFPVPQSFQLDPDSIFAEDLELFAGFQRNSVFIVRKGCNLQKDSFQFQFGILRQESQGKIANLSAERDLQWIWPKMFTANNNFMRQKGLLIKSVTQSHYLRPLIGYPEWVYADVGAKPGWGVCWRDDPVDCYFWEMAFLFILGIYLGAEITRILLWRLLWWRHGVPMPQTEERRGRRWRNYRQEEEEGASANRLEEERPTAEEGIQLMRMASAEIDEGQGRGREEEEAEGPSCQPAMEASNKERRRRRRRETAASRRMKQKIAADEDEKNGEEDVERGII